MRSYAFYEAMASALRWAVGGAVIGLVLALLWRIADSLDKIAAKLPGVAS